MWHMAKKQSDTLMFKVVPPEIAAKKDYRHFE
jgi:hypothetical protein